MYVFQIYISKCYATSFVKVGFIFSPQMYDVGPEWKNIKKIYYLEKKIIFLVFRYTSLPVF